MLVHRCPATGGERRLRQSTSTRGSAQLRRMLAVVSALVIAMVGSMLVAVPAQATTSITLDGTSAGRTFDGATANSTRLQLYACHGGANQRWTRT